LLKQILDAVGMRDAEAKETIVGYINNYVDVHCLTEEEKDRFWNTSKIVRHLDLLRECEVLADLVALM